MRNRPSTVSVLLSLAAPIAALPAQQESPPAPPEVVVAVAAAPRLVRTIALPGVAGRIDHLACALAERRLFVAALGNGSVEAIDLEHGERRGSRGGLAEPQGIVYLPKSRRVVVACGGDGRVLALDADDLEVAAEVDVGGDADNVRATADGERVFVACGSGAIATLDVATWKETQRVEFAGHPEGFQVLPDGTAFVDVPGGGADGGAVVLQLDLEAGRVLARWPLTDAEANFPMALSRDGAAILVGCREPAAVAVLATADGKRLATHACVGDVDDLFVDAADGRLFAIGGGGAVDVFAATPTGYRHDHRVATRAGARTGLWVPELRRLFVAVPRRGDADAEVREYAVDG